MCCTVLPRDRNFATHGSMESLHTEDSRIIRGAFAIKQQHKATGLAHVSRLFFLFAAVCERISYAGNNRHAVWWL